MSDNEDVARLIANAVGSNDFPKVAPTFPETSEDTESERTERVGEVPRHLRKLYVMMFDTSDCPERLIEHWIIKGVFYTSLVSCLKIPDDFDDLVVYADWSVYAVYENGPAIFVGAHSFL